VHIEEALWINTVIKQNHKIITKVLNVGSSTDKFRKFLQPHIDKYIFRYFKE